MIKQFFDYTNENNLVWKQLMANQLPLAKKYACPEYLIGLEHMAFPLDHVPSLEQVSTKLTKISDWSLEPVDSIIAPRQFFEKLSNKVFPVVRMIRDKSEIDFYTNESPDVFHEYFGHCPMLTNKQYADNMHIFAQHAAASKEKNLLRFAKIYWATFEFGLIKNSDGIKIYGAGILPSKTELLRVINQDNIQFQKLDVNMNLDSSLQGNINQSLLYYINNFNELYSIINYNLQTINSPLGTLKRGNHDIS